ncbi:hypothetical protein [Nocardia sp. A7]|uniref:hypothetical protein n=1 Tax=Nocardia sp. A7 TaxID=2789274 RepID=UPI00397CB458
MTYPSGQQDPAAWGQPPATYAQEIAPLGPPPKSNAGWIVIALVVIAGLIVGAGLLISAGSHVAGTAVAASATGKPSATSTTSAKPTTTTKPKPKAGGRLTYTDYEGPWNFKLGDVEMKADWVEGRDHNDCAPIAKGSKITGLGCQHATEMLLTAEGGAVKFTQFVLAMKDAAAAETAAEQIEEEDLNVRAAGMIDDFATGKWKAGASKEFVVITLVTATGAVEEARVEKYLRYRHGDIVGAIAFR